jgi:Family of unknown function (DUF6055)
MRRICTTAATTALLVLLLSAASVAHAGTLSVRSVSAPRSATAGLPAEVQAGIGRKGRTPAATVRFYLSANAKRDRRDIRLKGDARVGRGRRSGTIRVAARVEVPAAQPLGAYRLIACVEDACRAARSSLRVTQTPVGTRELVEAAVAAHKISPQQGLVYRVFGAFGDRRLPAAYAGDDAEPEDGIMREVVSEWPRLSRAQQRQLRPFFIPPAAKGSWASRAASAAQSGAPGAQPVCDSNQLADRNWRSLAQDGGHVRVWWLKSEDDRVGPGARSLVAEIENHMWPRLVAVFGREPLPDGKQKCFHGIDSKVDIYMLRLPKGRALTLAYPPKCAGAPAYVVFDATYGAPNRWEVAHELTHTFQYAYRYHGSCDSYNKWDEAVANWGASYLYPKDDSEHAYAWLLRDPQQSLADASYEGWAFPYAMQQLHGTGTIRSIYEQTERLDVLQAIDAGVPGGMKKAWPEFALAAWNQNPVSPNFEEWDKFGQLPEANGKPIAAEQLDPGPAGQVQVEVPLGLKPLTRSYRRFKLGPGVTQITVEKPSYADVTVQALVHTRDGTWKTEDWFRRQPVWCPRDPKNRPDEIILILSNNSLTQPSSGNFPVRLIASNIGCSRYTGEASGTSTYTTPSDSMEESWKATGLVYERILADDIEVPRFIFNLTAGSVTWSMSGHSNGCAVKAGPATLPVRSDGYNGQLDIRATSTAPGTWDRRYFAQAFGFPAVQGTATCPSGTYTRWFGPRTSILSTSAGVLNLRSVLPDGSLGGTETRSDTAGLTATWNWNLVPER